MKALNIGELTATMPVIQGGMGIGISLSGLAAAVANAGGIGIISAVVPGFREKDLRTNYREANIRALRQEIATARSKTKGIIGVNIMVALTNFVDMVKTSIEENVDLIISGAGLPLNLPSFLRPDSRTKLVPIVSSDRAADLLIKKWHRTYNYLPDAIVLESPRSGGHQGVKQEDVDNPDFSLDAQLPKLLAIVERVKTEFGKIIPVIVAGGIYLGKQIRKYMDLGAAGVQMGTRFITTHECDADQKYKDVFLGCKTEEEITLIKSPVGMPLRIFKNRFFQDIVNKITRPKSCPYKCLQTCEYKEVDFCIINALIEAQKGNVDQGIVMASTTSHTPKKMLSVSELMQELSAT